MRFTVLTLFPELFDPFLSTSLLGKAVDQRLQVDLVNFRDFALDPHRSVDDTPYGGGAGMVLKPEPLAAALDRLKSETPTALRVLLTPQGRPLTQSTVARLARVEHLILICGRYEGVDERIRELYADEEISIGDFVLAGGEVAAMAVIEAVSRMVPGVMGNESSAAEESFSGEVLEYPQYTRPSEFRGHRVPDVLLSGDHAKIATWRREQALLRTAERRPDLLGRIGLEPRDLARRTYVALVHHPVYDRKGQRVATALTNLDLHDIARACRTYGLPAYFAVTPVERQQELVMRIQKHWTEGYGGESHADRREALKLVKLARDMTEVHAEVVEAHQGLSPVSVATSARNWDLPVLSTGALKGRDELARRPMILMFGTGWGLASELIRTADFCLKPIEGLDNYNHLSVRSAVSIYLDRLFGRRASGPAPQDRDG